MSKAVSTVKLSDDPRSWSEVVVALSTQIRSARRSYTLDEAATVMDVLATLEQVRIWCVRWAGVDEDG